MSDTQSREQMGEGFRYSPERPYRPRVSPPSVEDKDACAIYASVRRDATPSHEPIELAIPALQKMLHRAGNVDGEGDGCGLLLDIPRKIWAEEVRVGGHDPSLALDEAFAIAHVFIDRSQDLERIQHDARELLGQGGFRILAERIGAVDSAALGPTAREEEPHFWQVAGLVPDAGRRDQVLFDLLIELEQKLGIHIPSFSATTCVYKVMGAPDVLGEYYPDLRDERAETIGCFGHNRYSTNTWPSFKRVQPFSVLGHNGEINTIEQLRQEARMLGVPIEPGSSDSQDLNRTIDTLVSRAGFSLAEAMEMVVPPIVEEIRSLPGDLHRFYMYLRQTMGPFAQGPVALIARHSDECVFSADALGLRPLWQVETEADYVFSSEPGVVPVARMTAEPKPLAPGEKALVMIDRESKRSTLHPHDQMLRIVRERWLTRNGVEDAAPYDRALDPGGPLEGGEVPGYSDAGPEEPVKVPNRILAGFGWQRDDVKLVQQMASNGSEPVGSLGYDGPLAALSPERQNLADYFKETVAVVTNPAIDREREMEHFSTRSVLGRRPAADAAGEDTGTIEVAFPVILGGHHDMAPLSDRTYRRIAREHRHLPARGPLGGVPRPRGRGRHLAARVGDDPWRDRADQTGGGEEGPRRRRAPRPHRSHGPRRRAPLPRPPPGHLGGRPGAEGVQGRAGGGEPAAPLRPRPALGRDPQRPRHDAGPRPRRQRGLPVHDGRGDLRRGLRDRRLQSLRGADQRDRESDLDDRHP